MLLLELVGFWVWEFQVVVGRVLPLPLESSSKEFEDRQCGSILPLLPFTALPQFSVCVLHG